MKLSPPQVGRLLARSRAWAWIRIMAGEFGTPSRCGRVWQVELADVERYAAVKFTPEQIAAATNTRPAHVPNIEVLADVD